MNWKEHKGKVFTLVFTAVLLMIPLVAMQFTQEVDWSLGDFIAAGALLIGSGLTIDFLARRSRDTAYKFGVVFAVGTGLLLIWVNLAVGIIGSEDNPANMMYSTVILIGFVGAVGAGFKPRGMFYALFVTAGAQLLVPIIAVLIWHPPIDDGLFKTFVLNTDFAVLFVGSGLLFRRASIAATAATAATGSH